MSTQSNSLAKSLLLRGKKKYQTHVSSPIPSYHLLQDDYMEMKSVTEADQFEGGVPNP